MHSRRFARCAFVWLAAGLAGVAQSQPLESSPVVPDAAALVERAFEAYRGLASIGTMEMTIHRPSWERTQTLKAWTRGERETLVTALAPVRDRGNGTLKIGESMWIYNPKVNRIIKLPPSMMTQSWMGSDFSNNDLAKSDVLITDFDHRIIGTEQRNGHTVYVENSNAIKKAASLLTVESLRSLRCRCKIQSWVALGSGDIEHCVDPARKQGHWAFSVSSCLRPAPMSG